MTAATVLPRCRSLSIVLPAYDEEANVGRAIEAARTAGSRFTDDLEIIVVDDGSRDGTTDRVLAEAAVDPRVRLIRFPDNRGYGAAVKTGLQAATKELVFFTDSDLQFDLEQIGELLARSAEAGVVVGYRADRSDSWPRKLNAWAWNRLQRALFDLDVRDVDCAFKLFRREVIASMPMRSEGAFFSTEILVRARAAGHRIVELPVRHYPRRAGSPSGARVAVIARAFRELWRLSGDLRT
ncbi:MAG: hypothetical protein QOD06_2837 [Candidatus Binatota bacterium]|nr:hypothetical protein [Candidatus Binatota bacterium]